MWGPPFLIFTSLIWAEPGDSLLLKGRVQLRIAACRCALIHLDLRALLLQTVPWGS